MLKYLDSESAIMFEVPLMCWEFSEAQLLIRVHTKNIVTVLWISSLVGSNNALCIHTSSLELYMNSSTCVPGHNFCMVIQIDISHTRKYSRLINKVLWFYVVMCQRHVSTLSLYPPIIFVCVLPQCGCWCSKYNVFYWFYF